MKLTKTDLPLIVALDPPVMLTKEPVAPPVQVTLTPWARLTDAIAAALVQVKVAGSVKLELKCCTSLPPEPLSNVNAPPPAGMKLAVVSYNEPSTLATAVLLAAGVAAYAIGLVLFRLVLDSGRLAFRLLIAILALPTIWLGVGIAPAAQVSALVLIIIAGIAADSRS